MPLNPEELWTNEKFYTITSIVDRCLEDNDLPDHYFDKFLGWGLWALREVHIDDHQDPKTVKLTMNDARSVDLPKDYVDWLIIGIQVGELVKTLGVNHQMVGLEGDDRTLGNPQYFNQLGANNLPNGINVLNYGGYRLANSGVFSVGGGIDYKGYFKIFKRDHGEVIQFSSLINKTDIYLEYISDGFNPNQETIVNPYFANYLRCEINSQWAQHKPVKERTESEIYRTGQDAYFAEIRIRGRVNPLDPKTLLNLQRQYYTLTPKN